MRIIVMSDSHGSFDRVLRIFSDNPGADLFLHLGDGAKEFEEVGWLFPDTTRKAVRGNCDFSFDSELLKDGLLEVEGKKIFYTHGDRYQVKYGLETLERTARDKGVDIALYGHTHTAFREYQDGLWLINPGSVRDSSHTPASYLALDITPAGIVPVIRKL